MTEKQQDLYTQTVKRLARMGAKDPTAQIIALAEEVELYRRKLRGRPIAAPAPPTLYGYEIPHLRIVAKLLREHNVTPEDLHNLANNFESAFNMIAEIQRRDMERQLHTLQERCFDPAVFAGVKLDLSPLKITPEQFGAIFKNKEEGQA